MSEGKIKMEWCERCMKKTGHRISESLTFSMKGFDTVHRCLECGREETR